MTFLVVGQVFGQIGLLASASLTDLFSKIERLCRRGNVWEHEKAVESYRQGDHTVDDETIGWLRMRYAEKETLRTAISNHCVH